MTGTGRLTTHVLDNAHGRPAAGMEISLYRIEGEGRQLLKTALTNSDGRCAEPLLEGEDFRTGIYELVFGVGDYFRSLDEGGMEPAFLDRVPVRFGIGEGGSHYHVPLLVSPFAYSTYRGS